MFRDESSDCEFNLNKILEQLDYNKAELNERFSGKEVLGNDDIERGNFTWKNGVQDTEVIWNPNPNGRFWIRKGCHPPLEYRNKKEKKNINGILAWTPVGGHLGAFGVDPYNTDRTSDGRGSNGAISGSTRTNTTYLPNEEFFLEYIDKPAKVKMFFEEVIMVCVYFSMPFLGELSNIAFLQYVYDRGYRNFSLNNPFKTFKELNPTERKLGGLPAVAPNMLQQFYAIEAHIENKLGVANDDSDRPIGTIGKNPFTRTITQWKDVDTNDRTDFDAYISSSLSRVACQKRVKVKEEVKQISRNPFKKYDNKGLISAAI